MKTALGMMVRDFTSDHVLSLFLDNAEKYGHPISRVIVAYSHQFCPEAAQRLAGRVPVSFIHLNHNTRAEEALAHLGVPRAAAQTLLHCPLLAEHQLVPYGFNRNTVLMEALLSDLDSLIFIDSDVYPYVLARDEETGEIVRREYDFFGLHLQGLQNASVTTSDYSGYNILPPAQFPHMDELLRGLQKGSMADFWQGSNTHNCLSLQENAVSAPYATTKVLGGNLGLRLDAFPGQPPFFSPYYFYHGTPYLARGEDTLLGLEAEQGGLRCLDIDLHIFHDTYGTYPARPDLERDPAVQNRLFYACAGWIGRNQFLQWRNPGSLSPLTSEETARCLEAGGTALSEYTGDRRFLQLKELQEAAATSLPQMKEQYLQVEEAWNTWIERRYQG